jgi:hypothetical protein
VPALSGAYERPLPAERRTGQTPVQPDLALVRVGLHESSVLR